MAEVKQKSGPFSLPLKKKPPSFNNNGVSSSFKHIYDDVFGTSSSSNVETSSSFMEDDYAEIFGSSNSSNGSWSIPYSSVPILELERDKGVCSRRGERVDYGGVFCGFDNGDGFDFGLPDGEVLFNQLKKKAKTSSLNDLPRSQGQSIEAARLESPSQSYDEQLSANGFPQLFDNKKHLDPENDKVTVKTTSRPRKAAHVRVYSYHEPAIKEDSPVTDTSIGGKKGNHYRHTSLDLGAQSSNTEAGLRKSSGMSVSNIVDASNGGSQPSKVVTNGFDQSPDCMKHSENEMNETSINRNSVETHTRKAAHVRVYSFHEPVIKDDSPVLDTSIGGNKGNHYRHTSLDLGAQSSNTEAGLHKASGMNVSLVDASNGGSQPSKAVTNGFDQSPDNTKSSENEMIEISINKNSVKAHTPEVHPISESTHSLHEVSPAPDVQPSRESNHSLNELDFTQETVSSKTSVLNGPQIINDVHLVEEQKRQSCNTSLDLDSRLNDNCDGTFQKPCGLTESTSVDNSVESCEASCASGPSYMVKDDVSVDRGKVKKKGRRSRMASVDLGDYKHSSEQNDGLKRKPRLGGSYSFDASHDPCAARVKVHSSMMHPSSSLPRYFPVESRYKISENSTGKCFQRNWDGGAGDSPPSLLEELDVNSDAAISAAMLQRAIEEAELRIRMAKAFLQREGQGSNNLRFKDTLKVRVSRKSSGVVNEVHKIKQTKVHEWFPPVAESEQKKPYSPLDRKHAMETTQRAPSFEDEKKCAKDEKLADRKDVKVPNLIAGDDDKREGEWEAAKHFNQLISGVKNKLASFISWQTETEKKDAVKEMEATMESQKHPEEIEFDFTDIETFKRKRTEQNEGTSTSSCEGTHGVNKLQFVSEAVEPDDQDVVSSFNVRQEKTENRLDSTLATTSLANFQFFAFRNRKGCDSPDQEVEEREPLETRKSEMVNGQEQVMDEEEIERIPFEGEEASQEESDDKCVTQDSMRLDDTSQSNDAGLQNEKIFEEPCSLSDHNVKDISVVEVCQGNTTLKDDLCSIRRENVEMVEDHYSRARHDKKESIQEEEEQDCMSAKSSLGSVNEEIDELVEQSSSFAGHNEKELPYEDHRQNDMYMFSHVDSCNEENKEMEGFNQAQHERRDVDHEEYNIRSSTTKFGDEPADNSCLFGNISQRNDENNVGEMQEEAKNQHANEEHQEETCKNSEFSEDEYECQEIDRDQRETNHFEEVPEQTHRWEDIKQIEKQTELIEETAEEVNVQESCVASADEGCKLNENVFISKSEESCKIDATSFKVEAVYCDEEIGIMDTTTTSEPEIDVQSPVAAQKASGFHGEEVPLGAQKSSKLIEEEDPESTHKHVEMIGEEQEPVLSSLSTETDMEVDRNEIMEGLNGTIGSIQHGNIVSLDSELDLSIGNKGVDVKSVDLESQCKLDNQTHYSNEAGEDLHLGVFDAASDRDAESSGIEAFHKRRRWFNHGETIATAELPSILEGKGIELEIVQEVLDESEVAGSVEIHADKLDSGAADVTTVRDEEASSNPDIVRTNVETTPTRRKWFVKEQKPEPVSLFKDIKVNLEIPLESMNDSLPDIIPDNHLENLNAKSGESFNAMKSNVAVDGEKGKQSGEAAPRRKRWFESGEHVGTSQQVKLNEDVGLNMEVDQESKAKVDEEQLGKHDSMPIPQETNGVYEKEKPEKESRRDLDEVNRRGKEKEKERIAVERAIREARERAFAEAKERARRHVADSPNAEARPKVAAGVQEKLGKVSSDVTSSSDKASVEAKLKAERAAVERATAEARERALQKALSEKGSHRSREQGGKYSSEKNSSLESNNQSSRGSDSSNNNGMYSEGVDGAYVESAQRRKARLERQTRTMERAAKALEEKNRRDLLAQKEQAAKNMMADSLDADVKRWCSGKEGNLRALLSTLQYVLGPESGWQPVSLTDLVASTSVRKAYKKATLCVHPDKLQQRGATIQQKYICEKVFDLLKDAWSKFYPDER